MRRPGIHQFQGTFGPRRIHSYDRDAIAAELWRDGRDRRGGVWINATVEQQNVSSRPDDAALQPRNTPGGGRAPPQTCDSGKDLITARLRIHHDRCRRAFLDV
jgi:hypothetical protein